MTSSRPSSPILLGIGLSITLLAFAGNSLLTRAALLTNEGESLIGPEAFVLIRLTSGAALLALLAGASVQRLLPRSKYEWSGALSLLIYALAFTLAYLHLAAGLGALLLFGVVQLSLLAFGIWRGEKFGLMQGLATALSLGGLILLLGGGDLAGGLWAGALMVLAGLAWAVQTALGQRESRAEPSGQTPTLTPTLTMAKNFLGACLMALPLLGIAWLMGTWSDTRISLAGVGLALASGALASGLGYALWYWVLPQISALAAGVSQLLVPLITTGLGTLWLAEPLGWRLILSSVLIVAGVLLALFVKSRPRAPFSAYS